MSGPVYTQDSVCLITEAKRWAEVGGVAGDGPGWVWRMCMLGETR